MGTAALILICLFLILLPWAVCVYDSRRGVIGLPKPPSMERRVNVKRAQHEADYRAVVYHGDSRMVCYTPEETKSSIKHLERAEKHKDRQRKLHELKWGHEFDPRTLRCSCGMRESEYGLKFRFPGSGHFPDDVCNDYTENGVKVREELLSKPLTYARNGVY